MQRAGAVLDKLDVVPVWIVDIKSTVTIEHRFQLVRDLYAAAGQVITQLLGVGCLERNVGQAILLGILQFREDLDVLMIIHLEIGK